MKGRSKIELENDTIVSRRQLQRIENSNKKDFLSLPKLMDLAEYYDISLDYLMEISDFMRIKTDNSYKDLFKLLIHDIDLKVVELEVASDSYSFFIFKTSNVFL